MALVSGVKSMERKPCWVNGRKGMFHRYIEKHIYIFKPTMHVHPEDAKVAKEYFETTGIVPYYFEFEEISDTFALIEFEDGHMEEIPPTTITFLDHSEFEGYDWLDHNRCRECEYAGTDCLDEPCLSCVSGLGSEDRFESRK